jgi:ribosomal protein S6
MARKKAVTTLTSSEALEPRVYELGYLLSPAVREEDLDTRVDDIKKIITDANGSVIDEARPEFIDIAYEMVKVIENKNVRFRQGYFGWIKFTLTPDQLKSVTELFEKNQLIIRMLVTKTVSENTLMSKKPISKILKATEREEILDEEILDDALDIDLGIAANELPTPVNNDIEVEPLEEESLS